MKSTKKLVLAALAAAAAAAQSDAALYDSITLTKGNASFTINNLRNHSLDKLGGTCNFNWHGSQAKQLWFWYRDQNHTREYALADQQSDSTVSGDTAHLHYVQSLLGGVDHKIDVTLDLALIKISSNSYQVRAVWKLRNLSPATVAYPNHTIRFYSYADVDAGGLSNASTFPDEYTMNFTNADVQSKYESTANDPDVWRARIGDVNGAAGTRLLDYLSNSVTNDLTTNLGTYNTPADRDGCYEHVATLTQNQLIQATMKITVTKANEITVPDTFLVTNGTHFSGGLGDLATWDENSMQFLPDAESLMTTVGLYDHVVMKDPSTIQLQAVLASTRPGLAYSLHLFNWNGNQWEQSAGGAAPVNFTPIWVSKSVNAPNYIRQSDGLLSAYVRWVPVNDEDPSQDGWLTSVNVFQYTLIP